MTTGVLLAAGAGSRMGKPKALVRDPDGTSWLVRSVEVLRASGCDDVLVVLGARADEARALVPPGARVVVADDWADGMAASLRCGLRALHDGEVAVVTLVDLPDVGPEVVRRVLAAAAGSAGLSRASYGGVPGHPVVLGRDHWAPIADDVSGDQGAKSYLRRHAVELVECGDLASGADQDEPAPRPREARAAGFPLLLHTVVDARDCRALAEFYRELLGLHYREGEEPPTDGAPDDADWLVLLDAAGNRVLTIQEKKDTVPPTWPSEHVPMQLHLDFRVPTIDDLERHRERAEALGARLLQDRSQDEDEPLYVLADPAGHPFCLLVQ